MLILLLELLPAFYRCLPSFPLAHPRAIRCWASTRSDAAPIAYGRGGAQVASRRLNTSKACSRRGDVRTRDPHWPHSRFSSNSRSSDVDRRVIEAFCAHWPVAAHCLVTSGTARATC